jgi:hypothetical protein
MDWDIKWLESVIKMDQKVAKIVFGSKPVDRRKLGKPKLRSYCGVYW